MAGGNPVLVRDIELALRSRAESVVREILPNARRDANLMRVGSIGGEAGQSLAVWISGAKQGAWVDFAGDAKGDMLLLVAAVRFGGDLGDAVAWAKSFLGMDDLDPGRLAVMRAEAAATQRDADARALEEAEAKKAGARTMWLTGVPVAGTPVARYLEARGIAEPDGGWPGSLRYRDELYHSDARMKLPAMVAQMCRFTSAAGGMAHVATHRTFIGRHPDTRAWTKAEAAGVGVPRGKSKMVLGRTSGAFVPMAKGASGKRVAEMKDGACEPVYLTEGVEDALVVMRAMPAARVFAAYSLNNIGMIEFPPILDPIVIVADRDEHEREQDALMRAIGRQQARGHRVQLVVPPEGVKDMNDWLVSLQAQAVAA